MNWDWGVVIVGFATITVFVGAFHVSGLVARAQVVVTLTRQTLAVISDKALDDVEKERAVQRAALGLFRQFMVMAGTAIVVLAMPAVVMWGGELIGLASFAAVSGFLLSWQVIIGATVLILCGIWLGTRH